MKTWHRCLAALLAILVTAVSPLSAADYREDIVFTKRGDLELKLDIALPDGEAKLRPTIVCLSLIHI